MEAISNPGMKGKGQEPLPGVVYWALPRTVAVEESSPAGAVALRRSVGDYVGTDAKGRREAITPASHFCSSLFF